LNDEGNGVHKDSWDTITMVGKLPALIGMSVGYLFAILGLNVCGMLVMDIMNAVMRTIIESMRTMCVWLMQLILFYALRDSDYRHQHPDIGEKWTVSSFMELARFLLLVTGMFVYNRSIELWFLKYEGTGGIPDIKEGKETQKIGIFWDCGMSNFFHEGSVYVKRKDKCFIL
jgi:hypothetical protein